MSWAQGVLLAAGVVTAAALLRAIGGTAQNSSRRPSRALAAAVPCTRSWC
jgi:hypothetical protein